MLYPQETTGVSPLLEGGGPGGSRLCYMYSQITGKQIRNAEQVGVNLPSHAVLPIVDPASCLIFQVVSVGRVVVPQHICRQPRRRRHGSFDGRGELNAARMWCELVAGCRAGGYLWVAFGNGSFVGGVEGCFSSFGEVWL